MIIDIPVDSVTKKRECIDRDYRTKGNQIIGNLCTSKNSQLWIKPLIKTQSRRFYPLEKTDKIVLQLSVFSLSQF